MPIFKVKAPNGEIIKVNAPEGASDEDVFDYAYDHYQGKNPSNKNDISETNPSNDDGYVMSALKGAGNFAVGVERGARKPFDYVAKKLNRGVQYGLDAITGGDFVKRGVEFDKKNEQDYQKKYGDSTAAWIGEVIGEAGVLAAPTNAITGTALKAMPYIAKGVNAVKAVPYAGRVAKFITAPAKNRTVRYMGGMALDGAVGNNLSGIVNDKINTQDDLTDYAIEGGAVGAGLGLAGKAVQAGYKSFVSPTVKSVVKTAKNITPEMKRRILKNSVLSNKLSEIFHKNYDVNKMQGNLEQARGIGLNPELNDISDNLFLNEAVGVRAKNEINDVVNEYDTVRDKNIDDVLKKIIPENISAETVGGNIRNLAKTIVDKKNQKSYEAIQNRLNDIVPQNADIAVVGNQLKTEIDDFVTNTDNHIIKNAKPLYDKAKRTDPFYVTDKSVDAYDVPDIKDLSIDNYNVDDAVNLMRGNTDIMAKRPITQFVMDMGGIKPGSDAAMQLYKMGIKPGENAPVGLFSNNGISRLDSFPDVDKGFASRYNLQNTDELGRVDYYEILERMVDEANGLGQSVIKDTPKRRDLSLKLQSMGLNPDQITKDDLVKALIEKKKQNFDPRESERLAFLEQAETAKNPVDLSKKTFDKYNLYTKHNLPRQLDSAQPDTGRLDRVFDDNVKFRRISEDDYEKPFGELPIDDFNKDFKNYIKPESVSLKDDKVIQDLIYDVRKNAQDFVAKNAPDDSIEMLLEVRNRLDNKIKLSNDGNTKQYINTRNKLNYVLGNDPLTKQADDYYKIKYDMKKSRDQDKYGYVINSRDGNMGSIIPNLIGNGTTPQQFYSLTNIIKPETKNQIAASYLRKIMNDFNVDDGFDTIYKKSFATNSMRDKFKTLLPQENFNDLENLMSSINNYRPDKKQLNKLAKVNDDTLSRIVPNLMSSDVSKQQINRLSKILPDKTKKDIVIAHLGKIKDSLNLDSNFDALYNLGFAKGGMQDKIKTLLPTKDFNNLSTVMEALSNLKSTKNLSKGSNTFNKITASSTFDDVASLKNIANSFKNGDKIGAVMAILGKASARFTNDIKMAGIARKNATELYDFFVNPDNLNETLSVLNELKKSKDEMGAKKVFYAFVPKIHKATVGLNRMSNTNTSPQQK